MSIKTNILTDAELAKSTVVSSSLDEDVKKSLVNFITYSALSTNGISTEQKIQSLTECMAAFASAIGMYMSKADERLNKLEADFHEEHPTEKLDKLKHIEQELSEVETYRNINGIIPNIRIDGECIADIVHQNKEQQSDISKNNNVLSRIFDILEKPAVWIFGCVTVSSPFAFDIIKEILEYFSK